MSLSYAWFGLEQVKLNIVVIFTVAGTYRES